jgi:hypothetical protein
MLRASFDTLGVSDKELMVAFLGMVSRAGFYSSSSLRMDAVYIFIFYYAN